MLHANSLHWLHTTAFMAPVRDLLLQAFGLSAAVMASVACSLQPQGSGPTSSSSTSARKQLLAGCRAWQQQCDQLQLLKGDMWKALQAAHAEYWCRVQAASPEAPHVLRPVHQVCTAYCHSHWCTAGMKWMAGRQLPGSLPVDWYLLLAPLHFFLLPAPLQILQLSCRRNGDMLPLVLLSCCRSTPCMLRTP